jgi:hypothetical protein
MATAGAVNLAGRQVECDCQPESNEEVAWGTIAPSTRVRELCRKDTEERKVCADEGNLRFCVESADPESCECMAQEAEIYQFGKSDEGWYMVSNPMEL